MHYAPSLSCLPSFLLKHIIMIAYSLYTDVIYDETVIDSFVHTLKALLRLVGVYSDDIDTW